MADRLKSEGFVPDVVYGHSGWGPMLFIKDIYPKAKVLCYFEWFYHAHGTDADFDPDDSLKADDRLRIRIKNTPILMDLCTCDAGLTPTLWQHGQFPKEYRDKITVLHDGIDTGYFQPKRGAKLRLPSGLDLSSVEEIVTYVSRGLEPYRGFPQFMRAVVLLHEKRKNCHVVVVGEDRVAYGKRHLSGRTYKELLLEELDLDPSRIHFTGLLPYAHYLQILQASSAHVYLTRPFVLSWSMLEAMSAGCLVIASNTAPVTEIIQDRVNGILVDFFSPGEIADRVEEALDDPGSMASVRAMARESIRERYDLSTLLPRHLRWMTQSAGR
jgi:glycosyltransferase involved in cell wall biosynthesis